MDQIDEPPKASKPKTNYDPKIVWDSPVPVKSPIAIAIGLVCLLVLAMACTVVYAIVDKATASPTTSWQYRR